MARDTLGNVWLDVHPKAHASRDELIALGRALEAWKAGAGEATIHGLEALLQGQLPPPSGMTLCHPDPQGEFLHPNGYRFSIAATDRFAVVMIHERFLSESEFRRSLESAVPPDLGRIAAPSVDY